MPVVFAFAAAAAARRGIRCAAMEERVAVRYTGRVQGVGFRATARQCAASLPVTGFVRNEPDGSVLLEAQGEPQVVEALLDQISRAMGEFISAADRHAVPARGGERSFEISR